MHEKFYMTNKYKVLEEMKFFEWDWIQLRSATLTEYELSLLSTLCRDDFNIHHSIYKRRKIEFHDSTKTEKSTQLLLLLPGGPKRIKEHNNCGVRCVEAPRP